jgi:hypothetical protein
LKAVFENGQTYSELFRNNEYMKLFLGDTCLRSSCYNCRFKKLTLNYADLTIGDLWGAKAIGIKHDDKGLCICNIITKKGNLMIDSIKNKLEISSIDESKYNIIKVKNRGLL